MEKKDLDGIAKEISQMMKGGDKTKRGEIHCMVGSSHEGKECYHGNNDDFGCTNYGMAFGCQGHWECSNSSFECNGGLLDDFECMGSAFDCDRKFGCNNSFDDEDCQHGGGEFDCDQNSNFKCSSLGYNL